METEISQQRERHIKQALVWLLPTWPELIIYFCVSVALFISSNIGVIRGYLSVPNDFYFNTLFVDFINNIVQKLLGREISASLSSGLFFGLVGLVIYSMAWLLANFSTELHNDLAVTKYVHPANTDTRSEIRDLVSKGVFRISIILLLVFYINLATSQLLPYWTETYQNAINNWPSLAPLSTALASLITQMLALHLLIILLRLVLLKKRLFFAADYHDTKG